MTSTESGAAADDAIEAVRLHALGYRQVSNRYRMVARTGLSDSDLLRWFARSGKKHMIDYGPSGACNNLGDLADHYRRVYATDTLTLTVPVFKALRALGDYRS